jgi:hypothetical protein
MVCLSMLHAVDGYLHQHPGPTIFRLYCGTCNLIAKRVFNIIPLYCTYKPAR